MASEFTQFVDACWQSGTILRSACGIIIVPLLAWGAMRLLAPAINRVEGDPNWQGPFAAAAAVIPGFLLLVFGGVAVSAGLGSPCMQTLGGRVIFSITLVLTFGALARALTLSYRRSREARTLMRLSEPARGRVSRIAERCGLSARVIADNQPFCALAGVWQPTVLLSKGALTRLDDGELEAALLHERGHARRGDQLVAAVLSFMVDLLPLPANDLVTTYRNARELAADQHALRTTAPHELAGALLSFVNGAKEAAGTAALAGDNAIRARLQLLLIDEPAPRVSIVRRVVLAAALSLVLGSGLTPAGAGVLNPIPCPMADIGSRQ